MWIPIHDCTMYVCTCTFISCLLHTMLAVSSVLLVSNTSIYNVHVQYIHVYLLSFSLSCSAIGRLPITICIRDPRTGAAGPCLDAVRKELFVKPGCEKFQLTTNVYAEDCTYIVHVYHTSMYNTCYYRPLHTYCMCVTYSSLA